MNTDRFARSRAWGRWHRRLAAVIGAWLLVLALTGVAINRAHDWGLDRAQLPAGMARVFYGPVADTTGHCGVPGVPPAVCAQVAAQLLVPAGTLLLTDQQVLLVDAGGAVVEQLPVAALGLARLEAVARVDDAIWLRGDGMVVRTDLDLVGIRQAGADDPGRPSAAAWRTLDGPADAITWERVFQDLHAARFLGPLAGPFNDLMAALLVVLALTGAWLWWLRRGG